MDNRDLPTIKQIIAQADRLGSEPMDDDLSAEWFRQTVSQNRKRREQAEGECKPVAK